MSKMLSFFDLPGGAYITNPSLRRTNCDITELRNLVYEAFLELEPSPTEAANLVASHKQIHAEFALMYLLQRSENDTWMSEVDLQDLDGFVNTFALNHLNAALRQVPFNIKKKLPPYKGYGSFSMDVLPLVSALRKYLLWTISWEAPGEVFQLWLDHEIESCVASLVNTGDQLSQLAGAKLEIVDHCCARHKHQPQFSARAGSPTVRGKTFGVRLLLKIDDTVSSRDNKRKRFEKISKLLQDLGFPAPEWYDFTCQETSQEVKIRVPIEEIPWNYAWTECSKFW
jgi:hypothetical protein